MRKLFTQMIKVSLLLLVMLAFIQVKAQKRLAPLASTDIQFSIENEVQISDRILEFQIYLLDTDAAQPFEYSLGQAGILVSNTILNGGVLTATMVAGSSQLGTQAPPTVTMATGTTNGCVKFSAAPLPSCGAGTIISTIAPGTRYVTVRLTNTNAFTSNSHANLAFQVTTTGVPPFTQTKVYQFPQPCPSLSTIVSTTASNCINNTTNPALNPPSPVVVTTDHTAVTATSATLNGTVNANTFTTTTSFDYGLTVAYGTSLPGAPLTVTGSTVTPVSVAISGLTPCTKYHYRLNGTYNGSTVVNGNDSTFTTLPLAPIATTNPASAPTFTTVTLNGTVNDNATCGTATVHFEYSTDLSYSSSIAGVPATATGTSATTITAALTGLTSGTLYNYRLCAVSPGGTSCGSNQTFTTVSAVLPTVITTAATSISYFSATVNGTVNANGTLTNVVFEYGTDPLLLVGTSTIAGNPTTASGSTVTNELANLTGLNSATTYYFRIKGTNPAGPQTGAILNFTTLTLTLPTVVTNAATALAPTSATLNGTVTANGDPTTVSFEYGPTIAYGSTIAGTPSPVTGVTATAVSANLTGLIGNACYHFRCKGVNSSGPAYGIDMTFCWGESWRFA
jgi:hypothetical protein